MCILYTYYIQKKAENRKQIRNRYGFSQANRKGGLINYY